MKDDMLGRDEIKDEIILTYDVADEALERAACIVREQGGSFTVSFCSGLQTCPA
jgi:hypothetical protein